MKSIIGINTTSNFCFFQYRAKKRRKYLTILVVQDSSGTHFIYVAIYPRDGNLVKKKNELLHEISNNVVCATSKASDQPAHTHSLIRAFASRLSIL